MSEEPLTLANLNNDKYYKVSELQDLLKNLGLNYSIFSIRDYETWKCLNYKCGKRYDEPVETCEKCSSGIRAPLIDSPRTRGGGKGVGHRRYTADEIRKIVSIIKERR